MGYERKTTPTIDKMAEDGLYITNAIAPSVPTGPSMFGIFTGEYCPIASDDFAGEKWRKELERRKTLAEKLSQKGYSTGAFHANPYVSSFFGFNKGFKDFNDFIRENELETLTRDSKVNAFFVSVRRVLKKEGTSAPWEKYYGRIVEWTKNTERPYFLWVLLLDTHIPYLPSRRKWCRSNYWRLVFLFWKIERRKWKCRGGKETETVKDAYDDEIYYADDFIHKLWEDLRCDNPIFIIHADHGDGLGEHGFYRHCPMLYEELIHVPLVVFNTDVKGAIDNPVSLRGLAPTILALIGQEGEHALKSILNGGEDWVVSEVFEGWRRKIAVRMKDWKFISGQKEGDELYHLKEDPYEQVNLISEYPDLVEVMREIVKRHVRYEEKKRIHDRIPSLRKFKQEEIVES